MATTPAQQHNLAQLNAVLANIKLDSTSPTRFRLVETFISQQLGLTPEDVSINYVADSGKNVYNRLTGGASRKRPRIGFVLVGDANLQKGIEVASSIIALPVKIFSAIVLMLPSGGGWRPDVVVEVAGGPVTAQIEAQFGPINAHPLPPPTATASSGATAGARPGLQTTQASAAGDHVSAHEEVSPYGPTGTAPTDPNDDLLLDDAWLEEFDWLLSDKKAVVLYGPPGTGKTFLARKLAQRLQPDAGRRTLVQLHPSYSYEDFFEGFRPVAAPSGGLALAKRAGPLRRLVHEARKDPSPVVLVIDEMNRGNLPKVFGELFFLLEYRSAAISLMYSPRVKFTLPENVYIIGTMNTADRSIAVLDQALRRRFHFVGLFPGEPPVSDAFRSFLATYAPNFMWLEKFLELVNERLADRNVRIGPSYFMRDDLTDKVVERVWKWSVMPTLEDQFIDHPDRLHQFDFAALKKAAQSAPRAPVASPAPLHDVSESKQPPSGPSGQPTTPPKPASSGEAGSLFAAGVRSRD